MEQVSVQQEAIKPSYQKKIVHETDASKESSTAEAWHQRLSVSPLVLPRNDVKGLTSIQSDDKSVLKEERGKRVLDIVPEETDSEQSAPKYNEVKAEAWTKVGKRVGKIPLSSLFQGSTPRGTVRRTTGRTDGEVH